MANIICSTKVLISVQEGNKYGDAKMYLLAMAGSWGDSVSSGSHKEYGPRDREAAPLSPNTCSHHWPFRGQVFS